jgi:hypothetical protein
MDCKKETNETYIKVYIKGKWENNRMGPLWRFANRRVLQDKTSRGKYPWAYGVGIDRMVTT